MTRDGDVQRGRCDTAKKKMIEKSLAIWRALRQKEESQGLVGESVVRAA